ncbi:MAG: HEPN domain-containing protein [Candidatus Eremiobacteraeota bacterium]|nr:HEPN domain-containing protein [Candidatus Eremiobacteraeota bacterium]
MDEKLLELSRYRMEKVKDDLESSRLMFNNGKFAQSANRSYYAMFHSTRALLAMNRFDSKKHTGIISYFNKNYIKTGKIKPEYGKMLMSAERVRTKSDYDDFYVIDGKTAMEQLNNATKYVDMMLAYVKETKIPDK